MGFFSRILEFFGLGGRGDMVDDLGRRMRNRDDMDDMGDMDDNDDDMDGMDDSDDLDWLEHFFFTTKFIIFFS